MNQIGICARLEPSDDIAALDRCSRHVDHRQQGGGPVGPQLADDVEAAHVWQVDIQNECIEGLAGDDVKAFGAGAGFYDGNALALQASTQRIAGSGVVIDNQHACVT